MRMTHFLWESNRSRMVVDRISNQENAAGSGTVLTIPSVRMRISADAL